MDKTLLQALVKCSDLRVETFSQLLTGKVTISQAMEIEAQWRTLLTEIQIEFDLGVNTDDN